MKNPKEQEPKDIEIVCAMLNEKNNKLERGEKPGDATEVGTYGSKDGVEYNLEDLINNKIETHEIDFYPEENKAERIMPNGTRNKIENIEDVKEAYKRQKEAGNVEHVDDKEISNDR